MALYEHVLIGRQDLSPPQTDALIERVVAALREAGGEVVGEPERWGLRPLAYRIRRYGRGHYAMLRIDAPPAALQAMERRMRLDPDVVRFLSVSVEAHEEGPSVVMRQKEAARESAHARESAARERAETESAPPAPAAGAGDDEGDAS